MVRRALVAVYTHLVYSQADSLYHRCTLNAYIPSTADSALGCLNVTFIVTYVQGIVNIAYENHTFEKLSGHAATYPDLTRRAATCPDSTPRGLASCYIVAWVNGHFPR